MCVYLCVVSLFAWMSFFSGDSTPMELHAAISVVGAPKETDAATTTTATTTPATNTSSPSKPIPDSARIPHGSAIPYALQTPRDDCVPVLIATHSHAIYFSPDAEFKSDCSAPEEFSKREVGGIAYCYHAVNATATTGFGAKYSHLVDITVVLSAALCYSDSAVDLMVSSLHTGAYTSTCVLSDDFGMTVSAGYDAFLTEKRREGSYSLRLFPRMNGIEATHADLSNANQSVPVAVADASCFAVYHRTGGDSENPHITKLVATRAASIAEKMAPFETDSSLLDDVRYVLRRSKEIHENPRNTIFEHPKTEEEGSVVNISPLTEADLFEFDGHNPATHDTIRDFDAITFGPFPREVPPRSSEMAAHYQTAMQTTKPAQIYAHGVVKKIAMDYVAIARLSKDIQAVREFLKAKVPPGAVLESEKSLLQKSKSDLEHGQSITHVLLREVGALKTNVAEEPLFIYPRRLGDFGTDGPDNHKSAFVTGAERMIAGRRFGELSRHVIVHTEQLATSQIASRATLKRSFGTINWDVIAKEVSEKALEISCRDAFERLGLEEVYDAAEYRGLLFRVCERMLHGVVASGGAIFKFKQKAPFAKESTRLPERTLSGKEFPTERNSPLLALSHPRRGAISQKWEGASVAWVLPCCRCCGFVNEAVDLMSGLLAKGVPVRLSSTVRRCMCEMFPPHVENMLNSIYINGSSLVRLGGSVIPRGDKMVNRRVVLITHGVPTNFEEMWKQANFNTTPQANTFYNFFLISRVMYEFTVMPEEFTTAINEFSNEAWTPAVFVSKMLKNCGVERTVHTLPEAVDTARFFHRSPTSQYLLDVPVPSTDTLRFGAPDSPQNFKFLSMFKWESRKGWDVLLETFLHTFERRDNVSLYVHTIPHYGPKATRLNITNNILETMKEVSNARGLREEDLPHICIYHSKVHDHVVPRMYSAADSFVLPTRGEGWGLPILQALSTGLPTIATNWSGPADFLSQETSFPLDAVEEEVPKDSYYGWAEGKKWAQPSRAQLKAHLKTVRFDKERATRVGELAKADVCKKENFFLLRLKKLWSMRDFFLCDLGVRKRSNFSTSSPIYLSCAFLPSPVLESTESVR